MEFPSINLDDLDFKRKIKLYLCKPDKTTIASLTEAFSISLSLKAFEISTLNFSLPLKVDRSGTLTDNDHITEARIFYLIKLVIDDYTQYFRIQKPRNEATEETDFKSYHCLSLECELADKEISNYSVTSFTIEQVFNGNGVTPGILDNASSNWVLKYVTPSLSSRYRSVSTSGITTILSFILNTLVPAYNCYPIFDTRTREISIYTPDQIGQDGLYLSYNKYIQTLGLEQEDANFCSRLKVRGKDGASINAVTPTGQAFIENFDYFTYPFTRYPTTSCHETTQADFATGTLTNVEATGDNLLKLSSGQTSGNRIWPDLDLSDTVTAKSSFVNFVTDNENQPLYGEGREFAAFVEGYSNGVGSQSKEADHFYLQAEGAGAVRTYVKDLYVDLTGVNTVFIDWAGTIIAGFATFYFNVSTDKMGNYNTFDAIEFEPITFARKISTIDVSALSGNYYLRTHVRSIFVGNDAELQVYRIGLGDGTDVRWINVRASIDGGSTWELIENNSPITAIVEDADLTGVNLSIKTEFYSAESDNSPELLSLFAAVRGKKLTSSNYMSDDLCHAQKNYEEFLEIKDGEFATLLADKATLQSTKTTKETEAFNLLTELYVIEDKLAVLFGIENAYTRYDFTYAGTSVTKTSTLESTYKYITMAKVSSITDLTVELDGTPIVMVADEWKVLGKITGVDSSDVDLSGAGTDIDVIIITVKITDDEYSASGNEDDLIATYCYPKKEDEYDEKMAEIAVVDADINEIDDLIDDLQDDLDLSANFSSGELEERNNFIIEKTYTNQNISDEEDLLEAAEEYFEDINEPSLVLTMSLANFLDILSEEAYYDKDKLFRSSLQPGIGDTVIVYYEPFNVNVECMILGIDLDVENSDLQLTVSNVREILNEEQKFLKDFHNTSTVAGGVLQEKYKWNNGYETATELDELLSQTWDTASRAINSGVNNSVVCDRRGITITDPSNALNVIRIVAGWLGISADGGNSYKTVLNANGIYAKYLVGQILLGAQLHIINSGGNITIDEDGLKVYDSSDVLRIHLGNYDTNKYGLKILDKTGTTTILDEDGLLQSYGDSIADNVDTTHKLKMKFYIPDETLSIRQIKLNFSLEAFRAYSTSADSENLGTVSISDDVTSSSGQSHSHSVSFGTKTSGSSSVSTTTYSGSHRHSIFVVGSTGSYGTKRYLSCFKNLPGSSTASIAVETNASQYDTLYTYGAADEHRHEMSHTHNVEVGTKTSTSESTHKHGMAHSHDLGSHSHDIVYGIYESTSATDCKVYVNGTERLGPYNTDQDNLDLSSWITTSGWQTVEISSDSLGRINASIFIQLFLGV